MSSTSILVAGFGGQGILFAGKQLALTGMYLDKKVTWLPSYGPESRGGTSNCTVIISDDEIGSPIIANPDILIVMNLPSYIKFHDKLAVGGKLFCDSSLIEEKSARNDINKYYIPATAIAYKQNMPKLANVIMLGKALAETNIFTVDELIMSMEKTLSSSKKDLLDANIKALNLGFEYAEI